jgi:aminoglycoside phosphotransferase (APT) family kinase protein
MEYRLTVSEDAAQSVGANPDAFDLDNDRATVVARLREAGLLEIDAPEPRFRLLNGGRSNLTYTFETAHGRFVLRRPPASHALSTAHDMEREFQIISALNDSSVAVPEALLFCKEAAVNGGVPFYVMEFVEGLTIDGTSVTEVCPVDERERLTGATIDQLARIHEPENATRPGIAELGRGSGYLARQVRRWTRQWDSATTRELVAARTVATWLSDNVPADSATALVHGDFRIDNCLYADGDVSRVVAVVDWEMGTVGDPYTDLATFLLYWVRPDDPPELLEMFPSANMSRHPGFPERSWIVDRYCDASGTSWSNQRFYMAMACFKLSAICEGIHARYQAGGTRGEEFAGYGVRAEVLMNYARRVISGDHTFTA